MITIFCKGCESEVGEFESEEELQEELKHRGMEEADIERELDDDGDQTIIISCGTCHKYGTWCPDCSAGEE